MPYGQFCEFPVRGKISIEKTCTGIPLFPGRGLISIEKNVYGQFCEFPGRGLTAKR
jgi:hypothetical protein